MKCALLVVGLIFATSAVADMDPNMDMGGGKMGSTPFAKDMDAGMKKMDHDMASAPMNGDVDHDFASMMVPHHQGAIEMAEGELKYGKDPAMRDLAKRIIGDQKKEIKLMREWMAKEPAAGTAK